MVMILSSSVLISLTAAYSVVVLPLPVGPGDQHHAVGFFDVAAEFPQVFLVKTNHIQRELVELLAHRFFVEHAEHGVFAVNRRHDGDAEIDGALRGSVLHPETAVLRDPALGNVQFAHHLDARNDGRVVLLGDGRHGLGEHAIDAELDANRVVASLDVNVTGAALQRGKDGGIDQTNNGADVALRGQPVNGDAFVAAALRLRGLRPEQSLRWHLPARASTARSS